MKPLTQTVLKAAFFLACLKLPSQTLTCQYNCPQPGLLFSIKTCSPVLATPGLNQVWNFTQVQAVSTGVTLVSYVTPSTVPSGNLYPQASVAKLQGGNSAFLEARSDGIKLATASNVTVSAQSFVLPLPFSYGSSHTETVTSAYFSGATKIETRTTKTLNGVGTGTLLLPIGTYTDVLLITGQTVESRTIAGVPEGNIVTNNFSYFYSEKIPQHLLYTEQKWETGPTDYGPYTEFIADLFTDVGPESKQVSYEIQLAPNPCSDLLQVTLPVSEAGELFVINAMGKTLQNLYRSGASLTLDLRDLPIGLYTLLVLQGNATYVKKFIVSR